MAYDNRDPAYVPSQQALAADAYIASTSPETHPDEYTYYHGFGHTYTGPMAHYTSGTEYNTWLNSSLGGSMFGSGQQVANSQNNNPYIQSINTQALLNAFPNAQDTATYQSDTNFPNLNPNQIGTVNPIGPAPESSSNVITNIDTNDAIVPPTVPTGPPVSVADVNALYNQLLGRSGADNFLQIWANSGMSLAEIANGIANSPEGIAYAASQSTTPSTTTDTPSTTTDTNSNNNSGVLTAAGLASALSMLIPQPEPPPPYIIGPSSGSSFSPAPIQGLSFSSPELAPIGSTSNQIDYVKQMRAGLFRDLV